MEGEVKSFGCDAIACRTGTYAKPFGRSTRFLVVSKHCNFLETSPYYGSNDCPNAINATDGTSSGSSSEKDILVKFFYATNGKCFGMQTRHDV
jgi:hypothetical protein